MNCPKCRSEMTVDETADLPWWIDQAWYCECGVSVFLKGYEEKVKE